MWIAKKTSFTVWWLILPPFHNGFYFSAGLRIVTGFEPQCAFQPKLGVAETQNWELPESQSQIGMSSGNNETMVLLWHGVYAETMVLLWNGGSIEDLPRGKFCQTLSLPWVKDVFHVLNSGYFVPFIHTDEKSTHMVILYFMNYRLSFIITIIITKKSFARCIKWRFMSLEWTFGLERERERDYPYFSSIVLSSNILLSRGQTILSYIYVSIKTREGGWDHPSLSLHCTFVTNHNTLTHLDKCLSNVKPWSIQNTKVHKCKSFHILFATHSHHILSQTYNDNLTHLLSNLQGLHVKHTI